MCCAVDLLVTFINGKHAVNGKMESICLAMLKCYLEALTFEGKDVEKLVN